MIVHKNQVKHLVQKKPQPPTLKAQIKIHKPGHPIRPVVDKTTAPTYKISKFLANKLNDYINLKYHYNAKDSITLANDLIKLNLIENHRSHGNVSHPWCTTSIKHKLQPTTYTIAGTTQLPVICLTTQPIWTIIRVIIVMFK
jgi:hypothetical protein